MQSFRGNDAARQLVEVLEQWNEMPRYPAGARCSESAWLTLEEERREVFDAVLESVVAGPADAERTAASLDLLRHVADLHTWTNRLAVS